MTKTPMKLRGVGFEDFINPKWLDFSINNYGQSYIKIHEDLSLNKSIELSNQFSIQYNWINEKNENFNYILEPFNSDGLRNQVIKSKNGNKILDLKDDEIIINAKFLSNQKIKIDDNFKINNFVSKEINSSSIVKELPTIYNDFKVLGTAEQIDNLFLENQTKNLSSIIDKTVFCYVSKNVFQNYLIQAYNNDNLFPNKIEKNTKINVNLNAYVKGKNTKSESQFFLSGLKNNQNVEPWLSFNSWNENNFIKIINFYLLQGFLFLAIGIILLIISVIFINFSLKQELIIKSNQIGILKAMGYSNNQLSIIYWLKMMALIIFGFLFGFLLSFFTEPFFYHGLVTNTFLDVQPWFSIWWFILLFLIVIPILLSFLNLVYVKSKLKLSPVAMINQVIDQKPKIVDKSLFKSIRKIKIFKFNFAVVNFNSTTRDFMNFLWIFLTSIVISLIILVQTIISISLDYYGPIFDKNINSSFSSDYKFNWTNLDENLNRLKLSTKANDYNVDEHFYNSFSDLEKTQDLKIANAFNDFLKISLDIKNPIPYEMALLNIVNLNVNNRNFLLEQYMDVLSKISLDYKNNKDLLNTIIPDSYKKGLGNIEGTLDKYKRFKSNLIGSRHFVGINNLYLKRGIDFALFKYNLFPDIKDFKFNNDWTLNLINPSNYQVFNSKFNMDKLLLNQTEGDFLPIIVSKNLFIKNKLSLNEKIDIKIGDDSKQANLIMKIVDVDWNNTRSNEIFAYDQTFWKNFVVNSTDWQLKTNVFYSRNKILNNNKINLDFINYIYNAEKSSKITFGDFISNENLIHNYANFDNLVTQNFMSINNLRIEQNKTIYRYELYTYIVLAITIFIFLMLFIVVGIFNLNAKLSIIKDLKASGYYNQEILFSLNKWFYLQSVISIAIAGLIAWGISILVQSELQKANTLENNLFSWKIVWVTSIIIFIVITLFELISYFSIKKEKPLM